MKDVTKGVKILSSKHYPYTYKFFKHKNFKSSSYKACRNIFVLGLGSNMAFEK